MRMGSIWANGGAEEGYSGDRFGGEPVGEDDLTGKLSGMLFRMLSVEDMMCLAVEVCRAMSTGEGGRRIVIEWIRRARRIWMALLRGLVLGEMEMGKEWQILTLFGFGSF